MQMIGKKKMRLSLADMENLIPLFMAVALLLLLLLLCENRDDVMANACESIGRGGIEKNLLMNK